MNFFKSVPPINPNLVLLLGIAGASAYIIYRQLYRRRSEIPFRRIPGTFAVEINDLNCSDGLSDKKMAALKKMLSGKRSA